MFKKTKAFSGFSVKDIPSAREFYTSILGLNVSESMGQLVLNIEGGGEIFVYSKANHVPATYTVLNFPVHNFEEAMDEMVKKGIKFIKYNEEDFKTDDKGVFHGEGPKIAWFNDPSGNILSVLAADDQH